jgi:sugar lactone lactonase YvrE
MRQAWRGIAGLLAVGALTAGGSVALADNGGGHGGQGNGGKAAASTLFTLDDTVADGNPEGIAFDKRTRQFFVSRTGTGAIYAGTLASTTATPFIAGIAPSPNPAPTDPKLATGMKVRNGLLYVAGANTGLVTVYDIKTKAKVAQFDTRGDDKTTPTFINDLDVDSHGDIFATDSLRPFVYRIDAASVKAGQGAVTPISVAPEIVYGSGFNLNGIVASGDGDALIVGQSNTGKLFRITLRGNRAGDHHAKAHAAQAAPAVARTIAAIDVAGLPGNDGLLKDRGRLLVVQGGTPANANGQISVVKLRRHDTSGRIESVVTDARLKGPSTIARAKNTLLVVNADFATSTRPFTVVGLSRRAIKHGGHGGR